MKQNNINIDSYPDLLASFILSPNDAEINFYLGYFYHRMNQTASAVSFYLRAAERTDDDLLKYECLLRASMCFDSQGSRGNSVIGLLQHAVALLPKRPEAYFLLSRYYERIERWFDGYMLASIGEKVVQLDENKLKTKIDYPGYYGLLFEKAVCGWWCGLCEESLNILKNLSLNYVMDAPHKEAIVNNLKNLGGWKESSQFNSFLKEKNQELEISKRDLNLYYKNDYKNTKIKFNGLNQIERNYSEAFQDIFVLTALNGKREGYYLEIGAGFPFFGNNTFLLESEFDWKGISIDIEKESVERYFQDRKNQALLRDATKINYKELLKEFGFPTTIDYLQVDCDPSNVTYNILTKIPFDDYRFRIITYEHDYYQDETKSFKQKSREYLIKMGYELVISDVSTNGTDSFEDWWVHPKLVNFNSIIKNTNNIVKKAKEIFLNT